MILQSRLTRRPWTLPALWRLPGMLPCDFSEWLEVDDAYAAQMTERARLIATAPVHGLLPGALPAAQELYDLALTHAPEGFRIGAEEALRPDGVRVALDRTAPLLSLGRLFQQDFCLMQKQGAEHVLTGAILCFPASWTLAEKLGRPLVGIHKPVPAYDAQLAARVQRLFDGIRPGQPLYRMNALLYADPSLHQPRSEAESRSRGGERLFVRSERQCLVRLPQSEAVVFSIHTTVVSRDLLTAEEIALLAAAGH